jgi:hypothetical protein
MLENRDLSSVPKWTMAITELWTMELNRDYLFKLSKSISTRLQMVLAAKGDMTKYRGYSVIKLFLQ